ncbi:hypothetical protein T492DRAFT_594131 [Pavlovales sp. CCMP2436]|nr:hypothetical protein T492DRAFT_594131 [Pavlovales sp. CCMP2436]|mmetsp:Transcript_3118/g.7667  ORF Transcript_3118/g.7667 Transcript_3118/m.7667 type:complete len:296 (+) Transcript_3118:117-1004(+)
MLCSALVLLGASGVGESAYSLRFKGIGVLYGPSALERFRTSHVAVIGLGGVGSWAAEALARSGIGTITLVDLDEVCISNTNRQLHSLVSTVGLSKCEVLQRRIREINPECDVRAMAGWVTPSNVDEFVRGAEPKFSAIIDAVDGVADKVAICSKCVELGVFLVTTGGAGGKRDATAVCTRDVCFVSQDPLLQSVRRMLRSNEFFPPEVKGPKARNSAWGLQAVSSLEPPVKRVAGWGAESCDTFGTSTFVTGTYGFAAAEAVASALAMEPLPEGSRYAPLRQRISLERERPSRAC